jgi:hypothetical protein
MDSGVRDMISKKKIAAIAFGGAVVATLSVAAATRMASHSASFGNSTKETTAPDDRRSEIEEFYKEYVCDHACRYTKY